MYEILILIIAVLTAYLIYKIYKFANTSYRVKTLIPSPISGKWVSIHEGLEYCDNFKLCDFFINSSYNSSFIGDLQYDYLDVNMIKNILLGGVRCLEFTIMASDLSEVSYPIVSNGIDEGQWTLNLNYLVFDEVCYTIQKYAFQNYIDINGKLSVNKYPLFINLNMKTNDKRIINLVYGTLDKYFGKQLVETGVNNNDDLANTPISKLFGKVIIISQDTMPNTKMENLVHKIKSMHHTDILTETISDTLTDYNKHNLSLIYPNKPEDVTAKNFDILPAVSYGCQFISLNYQVKDSNLKKYQAMFDKRPIALKKSNLRDDANVIKSKTIESSDIDKQQPNNIMGLYELYRLSGVSFQAKTDAAKILNYNSGANIFEFVESKDDKDKKITAFKMVPGLLDNLNTISFRSLTDPNKYLSANEGVIQMLNNEFNDTFNKNSSFYPIRHQMELNQEYYSFMIHDKQNYIIKNTQNRLTIGSDTTKNQFTIKTYPTTKYQILKDYNDRAWTVVSGNFIQCISGIGTKLRIVKTNDTFSYMQTEDGKYVSYDGVNNIVLVDKPMIDSSEKFEITPMYDGTQVMIRTIDNKDVSVSPNGLLSVNGNGNKTFKIFELEIIG